MKNKRMLWMLTAGLGICALTGCGGEEKKVYKQAAVDLEQGSYDYALQGFQSSISSRYKTTESYRGAGISNLHLGNYQDAIDCFTSGLDNEKATKKLKKDMLAYRATAELKADLYEAAMADCQTLAEEYTMDADTYYLTGCVALAMDSYDEASSNFTEAYSADATYDMAIQIYEAYLEKDMEADGTRYLEQVLQTEPKDAADYCDRGKAYYYMQDYTNAQKELTEAVNKKSTEGMLLLGMVYQAQGDTANARAMYQQYVEADGSDPARGYNGLALCDMDEGSYDSALENISKGLEDASTEEMQDLYFNEIVVYEKQLDFATALSKMQEYIKMFPDDENAAKELTFLQSRNGELSNDTASDTTSDTAEDTSADTGDSSDSSDGYDESGEEEY
ncbi:tetratricopeptide repeat protein [Blautia sp. MSJ-19]|uniref:tetratricopeptide repeat protein n=1 Tax=Blautia sp. MSJ-19 TaxID=2841517 RepID=UPI001C0F1FDC|nr:tetratricopeptide repeat protein [Blautia sp. MSJ-19]MBU5480352.1 tetratricopeptide repeat protein [Blautia sp. MSJ-19]